MIDLAFVGKALGGLFDLVREVVPDKDKQAELQARIADLQSQVAQATIAAATKQAELEAQVRTAELAVKTYPWVDALHKMGRQLSGWLFLFVVGGCQLAGNPIDPATASAVAAVLGVYNYVKGRGQ